MEVVFLRNFRNKNSVEIQNIQTSYILNENVIFTWENGNTIKGYILPSHNLIDNIE